jgi:hypothetical protein
VRLIDVGRSFGAVFGDEVLGLKIGLIGNQQE